MLGPDATLDDVAAAARACRICADRLPLGPRPVLRVSAMARLLIVGQAPGSRVHASGIPWNDPSGERLRMWMGVTPAQFYDAALVAIVPMGLCYPGVLPNGGDRPPDPVCAPTWHPRLLALMPRIEVTLVVGTYAQGRLLGKGAMTAQVERYRTHLPRYFPLPHPSWRTIGWEMRHPWFGQEVLPALREVVAAVMGPPG